MKKGKKKALRSKIFYIDSKSVLSISVFPGLNGTKYLGYVRRRRGKGDLEIVYSQIRLKRRR